MKIAKNLREYLVAECRTAAKLMDDHGAPTDKVFYFSAVFAGFQRVVNIDYEDELVLALTVTQSAHALLQARVDAELMGREQSIQMAPNFYGHLANSVRKLADQMEQNKSMVVPLTELCVLSYTTTGNGYYLLASKFEEVKRLREAKAAKA
jgi:hypothetical protein